MLYAECVCFVFCVGIFFMLSKFLRKLTGKQNECHGESIQQMNNNFFVSFFSTTKLYNLTNRVSESEFGCLDFFVLSSGREFPCFTMAHASTIS